MTKGGEEQVKGNLDKVSEDKQCVKNLKASLGIGNWSLVIVFYLLDLISKRWIVTTFEPYSTIQVIPGWFNLVYVVNTGAAFGSFKDSNTMFIIISAVTFLALVIAQARGAFQDRWSKMGLTLLLAGILGNLTDRFLYKHVIDFLDFDLHVRFANPWPSFNVADSCICVAVGLFIIGSILEDKRKLG